MALKHDAQGFLVGDPIDIGRALAVWDDIRNDVRAIRKAVLGVGESPSKPGHDAARVEPYRRRGAGMEEADPAVKTRRSTQDAALLRPAVTPGRKQDDKPQSVPKAPAKPAIPGGRDGRGRFVAAKPAADGGSDRGETPDGNGESALRSVADRIVSAVNSAGAGMEEADPAVKAFQEVAQPMARGYEFLTGGSEDKKQVGFLRRIFTTLTGFRNDESAFNKAANKSLKNLEAKPEGGEGGSGGIWGTILSAIMGIGPAVLAGIGTLLSKIPGIGPMFGGGAGAAGGAAKGAGGFFKGALKKIPLLGSLLAVGGAAADIYGSENDDKLSRREKDKNAGKAVGGAGGTIAGMAAGAAAGALLGPVGAVVGGVVGAFLGDQAGQIIGDTVGGWVSDLREADIPGKIVGAWEATTDFLKKGWDGALEKLSDAWRGIKDAGSQAAQWASDKANAANNFIKDKTGFDAKAGAQRAATWATDTAVSAKTKAVEVGGQAVDSVKKGAEWAADNTTVGKGVAKAWEGAKTAGNWVLGQTSKLFESGKGGAGTVSSGKGDFGGASYGTYQLSSTQGTLQKFLKGSKYGDQFAGLQPGTPEFNAKWKEVAKADPEFGNAQHDFIKASHYDPQIDRLKKGGIDLSGRGAAVQDAVWSTSVQFGGNSSLIEKSLKGKDTASMSDADIVSAIQDYKVANNDKLFASSSAGVRAGTAKRAVEEKNRLLALAGQDSAPTAVASQQAPSSVIASPAPPVVASISAPPVSVAPTAPPIAEAPTVAVPMASADTKKAAAVAAPAQDAGQDLKDRRIAHIVTGGLSNG